MIGQTAGIQASKKIFRGEWGDACPPEPTHDDTRGDTLHPRLSDKFHKQTGCDALASVVRAPVALSFFQRGLERLKTLRSRGWTTSVKWLGRATRCTHNFTASSMMALVKWVLLPSTMRTTALKGFAVGLVREANSLSHSIKMSSEDQPVLVAFTEIGQASC